MDELNIGATNTPATRQMPRDKRQSAQALNDLIKQSREADTNPQVPHAVAPVQAPAEPLEIPKGDGDDSEIEDGMRYAETHVDNPTIRKQIEGRCGPIIFDELLTTGKVSQKVPILPGKYEVIFQSVGGDEDLYIKKIVFEEKGSDGLLMDMYSYMRLAIFVKAVNGQLLPPYRNSEGEIDPKAFERRWKLVAAKAESELEILSCNARWFHDRTQRMWIMDELKNG